MLTTKANRFSLGGTLFGWTLDQHSSFSILDYFFYELGQSVIDTADSYSQWFNGNSGGESETIIGNWIKSRQINRHDLYLATKIGKKYDRHGFQYGTVSQGINDSMDRLQTDYIDLLFFITHLHLKCILEN